MTRLRWHHLRLGGRRVVLAGGPAGWGEASPLAGYPCPPYAPLAAALEAAARPWPPTVRDAVPVNALVADEGFRPEALVGFGCVKVKVGRPDPDRDVALVRAVRDAVGPRVALRVDANGAWDEETARRAIARLAPFGLEFVEQPVRSLEAMARLRRRVGVALAADESVRSTGDDRTLRRLGAADVVVLKVQALGGMRRALEVADAAGVPAVVTSMMETSVGLAVGLRLAACLDDLPFACGLGTAGALGADVTRDPLVPVEGRLSVRRVAPDEEVLAALGLAAAAQTGPT